MSCTERSRINALIGGNIRIVPRLLSVIFLAAFSGHAVAQTPPLPQPRAKPPAAAPRQANPAPAAPQPSESVAPRIPVVPMEEFAAEEPAGPSAEAAPAKDEPSACRRRVADQIAVIEPLPMFGGPGDCGATDVVKLEAIIQPDKSRIAVSPPATLRCTMAEALATWVREDLTAATASLGSAPRALDNYASYDCRGRNRLAGARISEHGLANAIDIRGVNLQNGKFAEFTDRRLDRGFRETIRKSVCARFMTVLGPGSDGHHETHIHLDLAERRNAYKICQWLVLDPQSEVPLPRPRPAEAP
jgi:hypothetical protein